MNDTQIIVIVVGLGGLLLFMSSKGSEVKKPEGFIDTPYPWPTHAKEREDIDVQMVDEPVQSTRRRGDAPTKKVYNPAVIINQILEELKNYYEAKLLPYRRLHYATMAQIARQSFEGPMREDLRAKVVKLQDQAMAIGTEITRFLNDISYHDNHHRIESYQEYTIVQELQDNWNRYDKGLNHDTWLINTEQARDEAASYTQNVYVQNIQNRIAQLEQQNFMEQSFNTMNVDERNQTIDLTLSDDFNTSPTEEPPSRLAIDSLEHPGQAGGLPSPTKNEQQIALAGSNQVAFVSNEIPENHPLETDQKKAAVIAEKGMTSQQQMLIKGGSAKPEPLAIEDDPERNNPFVTIENEGKEPEHNPDPPQPVFGTEEFQAQQEQLRIESSEMVEHAESLLAEKISGKKSGREADSAPDPGNDIQEDLPENSAKRPKPPAEFDFNAKTGGQAALQSSVGQGKYKPPDVDGRFAENVRKFKEQFLVAEAEGDEIEMGIYYWEIATAGPTGGDRGRYYSKSKKGMQKCKAITFFYLKEKGFIVAQRKTGYDMHKLNDIMASPEYKWWESTVWPIAKKTMGAMVGGVSKIKDRGFYLDALKNKGVLTLVS